MYLSSSLAYVFGPLAGGKLADKRVGSWFDYATPFWAASGSWSPSMAALALAAAGLMSLAPEGRIGSRQRG